VLSNTGKKSIVEMATFTTGRNARKLIGKKFQPTNEMMLEKIDPLFNLYSPPVYL